MSAPARDLRARLAGWGPTYGALVALVVLVVWNAAFTSNFATTSNFWNLLLQTSTPLMVAAGMTLVMATGGIDLSVGSVMAMACTIAGTSLDHGAGAAIVIALVVAVAVGLFNGAIISGLGIPPFIVTLAMMVMGRGIAQVISHDGELVNFSNPTFESLGRGYLGPVPVQVAIAAVVVALALFATRATSFGRYVLAIGGNEPAARLAGVRVHLVRIAVYVIAAFLAGLAGLIETARLGTTDAANVGRAMEFHAIAMALIGGTSLSGGRATITGTVIGAFIMIVITASFTMRGVDYAWSLVVEAGIILFAVFIQRPKLA